MKIYAVIPVNDEAQEMVFPENVPALFSKKEDAEKLATEYSVDGEIWAVEEVTVR